MRTTYYLIQGNTLGKSEKDAEGFAFFVFEDGKWAPDSDNVILEYLMSYNPWVKSGSPYGSGNVRFMDKVEEISKEEALRMIG